MHIAVVTLFPGMFEAVTAYGVTGRAVAQGGLAVTTVDPRDFTCDRHRTVDDRPYGGGPGMLMKIDPLRQALRAAREQAAAAGTPPHSLLMPNGHQPPASGAHRPAPALPTGSHRCRRRRPLIHRSIAVWTKRQRLHETTPTPRLTRAM